MAKFQATLKTSDFRGDHSASVSIALDVSENTTIRELIENVFEKNIYDVSVDSRVDHIELRIVNGINSARPF